MAQIEPWAVKLDAPAALRSACNVTRDVVIADHKALDVDTLDIFSVRCEPERKFCVEPRRLHLDLTQPCDLDHPFEISTTLPVPGTSGALFQPVSATERPAARKVEPGLSLGAPRIKDRIGQINVRSVR